MSPALSPWFPRMPATAAPLSRLFCFHHAGAGASAYRTWLRPFGGRVEIVPVQLPGRETRFTEPAEHSIRALTARLVQPVLDRAGGVPFAFFGHSMGALLAYDLSVALARQAAAPTHLVVSGYAAPHVRTAKDVHLLADEDFLAHVVGLEGTSPDVLANPSLLELLLPVLRDDFTACETYEYRDGDPLDVPVTAFGGTADPGVTEEDLRAWADLTTGPSAVRMFPGGHFYLVDEQPRVLTALAAALELETHADHA
jgi:surfactin synthase thioesterase subunit